MNKNTFNSILTVVVVIAGLLLRNTFAPVSAPEVTAEQTQIKQYWFVLYRASGIEMLYHGTPGDYNDSTLVKIFPVKTGIPGERPTPLPELVGREYWKIINKLDQKDNPETAPYFLTLDVPAPLEEPYGPVPYEECNGQCNWVRPGDFGLHGTAGIPSRLSKEDPGSSGCIRHSDADITYLYHLLDPEKEEIRYYVFDK